MSKNPLVTPTVISAAIDNLEKNYRFEFTRQDHIDLADELHAIKGLAMVSSYESDLYDELYKDWNKIKFPVKFNNIRSSRVQEVIYMNYNKKQGLFD